MTIPMAMPQSISEPRRDTPVLGAFDVLVLVLGVADDLLARMRALSGDMDNLLVAGRCASMTPMGQSAARVSGTCCVMGQDMTLEQGEPRHSDVPYPEYCGIAR